MYHNVRDSLGRFTKGSGVTVTAVSSSPAAQTAKDELITKLKNGVYLTVHEKQGVRVQNFLTLLPSYIGAYVGKGTSRKTNPSTVFAYDVMDECFKAVNINTIEVFEEKD
jgi:hypothetical protein